MDLLVVLDLSVWDIVDDEFTLFISTSGGKSFMGPFDW